MQLKKYTFYFSNKKDLIDFCKKNWKRKEKIEEHINSAIKGKFPLSAINNISDRRRIYKLQYYSI